VCLYFFVIDNTLKLNVATVISNEQVKTELCCHMLEWFVTLVISFDLKTPSKYHQEDVIFETFE